MVTRKIASQSSSYRWQRTHPALIVGHVLVPIVFVVEKTWYPPMWLHMAIWLPLFAILSALFLRPVKGAVVAWMLRLGLTGTEQGAQIPPSPSRTAPRDA